MNAPFHPETISLDLLEIGTKALVLSIDWASLENAEASRLRHFGFDEGPEFTGRGGGAPLLCGWRGGCGQGSPPNVRGRRLNASPG